MSDALFAEVCRLYDLGSPILPVKPLTGGLLHRMFLLRTEKGRYAVKLLNPAIMERKQARIDLEYGEKAARHCLENGLPAVTALRLRDRCVTDVLLQNEDDTNEKPQTAHVMVFPYVEAKSRYDRLSPADCVKLMEALGGIHLAGQTMERKPSADSGGEKAHDFARYLPLCKEKQPPFAALFAALLPDLIAAQTQALSALTDKENVSVISHRDLDRKNVLWDAQNNLYLIDWESTGEVPRAQEMTDVALSWTQDESGRIDRESFACLLSAYLRFCPMSEKERRLGFYESLLPRLGWLDYNLVRALEQTGEEQTAGAEQTELTLRQLQGILELEKEKPWRR